MAIGIEFPCSQEGLGGQKAFGKTVVLSSVSFVRDPSSFLIVRCALFQ